MRPTLLAIFAFLSTAGCSWSGGSWLGLFPAPKFLDGSVEGSRYTAPDHSFTVALPHPEGSGEWAYTVVREHQEAGITAAQFGPAAFDQGTYAAAVHHRPPDAPAAQLENWPEEETPPWVSELAERKKAAALFVHGERVTLADRPALFQLFQQAIDRDWTVFLVSYLFVIDDDRVGEIRGLFPTLSSDVDLAREKLRSRTYDVLEAFASSLQVPPPEGAR